MAAIQKFYASKEVAAILGIEESTFKKMVTAGQLPQAIALSKRMRMWTEKDIEACAWLLENAHRLRKSTPDEEERDSE